MRVRTVMAALLVGLLTAAGLASPAQAATVNASYNIWVWNVAGYKMHRGATGNGLITALANSVRYRSAHFVALNELCWSQYKAVQANLRASGWPQDVENFSRFEPQHDTVCGGEPFGLAIFSKAPLGTANRYALAQDSSSERRRLLCAPLSARPHLRFCTTHITPSNEVINGKKINETQLDQVRARLEAFEAAGDTVIIGGDFNAQPHYGRLNNWYSTTLNVPNNPHNTGAYRELDDTDSRCPGYGEQTTEGSAVGLCEQPSKIDLIFVRENRIVGAYTGDSLAIASTCGGPCSDHRIVIGTVTVAVTT